MRKLILALAFLLPAPVNADERILSYDSRIQILQDSRLEVTETLLVRAEGTEIKRGIFRELPTVYPGRQGRRSTVGFELRSVRRDGKDEPHHLERRDNGVAIYIGREDVFLSPGEYRYAITYRTDRQLGFFAGHDELYWNVTGHGWAVPIDKARAELHLPAGVPGDRVRLEAYTGRPGAQGQEYTAKMQDGLPVLETTHGLAPGEGLTIVATWPKGFVAPPSDADRVFYALGDNRPLVYAMVGLTAILGYYFLVWIRLGRDPQGGVIIPRYQPPVGESPASMRVLSHMGYDNLSFVAGVLSLAVKGYLGIEQSPDGLFKPSQYTLTRKKGSTIPLSPDEHVLLRGLLTHHERLLLDDENHEVIGGARAAHKKALMRKYDQGFFRTNGGWFFLGVVLSLGVAGIGVIAPAVANGFGAEWFLTTGGGWATLGLLVVGLVANGVSGKLLKAPTREGRRRKDEIEGFRLYLDVAEGEEIKLAGAPQKTASLFATYLPFALALGVEQRWAEKFAGVFLTHGSARSPDWYDGDHWDPGKLDRFSSSLGSSFDSAISSAATPPGSSSGSGGGGSSGGGGGGGGGGGW